MPTRRDMWNSLKGHYDVLVVGGGITGAGIARDAARRGLEVALVEMHDLAWGTSSRSSKLVHGGLRYLEQYEFSLVFEAVSERRILLDIAPHLVNPLGFIFPVFKKARKPLWMISTGMWLYDGLSLFRSPKLHRTLDPKQVRVEEPALRVEGLSGAPLYYDCYTDDARLTLETAVDATRAGAVVATWAKAKSFLFDEGGRISGAVVEDLLGGEEREVRATVVINATGPWTDKTVKMSRGAPKGHLLRPTKGVHIVVPRDKLPVKNAVVCFHPKDGRVLFAIPWDDCAYVGTTDTDFQGDPAEVAATSEDVDYLIQAAGAYFPDHPLTRADVLSTWAGLRPLVAPPDEHGEVAESKVSREHEILVGADGLVTIAGGKLTTYRRMAAECVDTALKLMRLTNKLPDGLVDPHTDREPLPGAVGWPADDDHEAVAAEVRAASGDTLPHATCRLLANTYGMRGLDLARRARRDPALAEPIVPDRPEIMAQVDWAVEEEMAATVGDVLNRRTQLFFRHPSQGLEATARVAERMASLLGWSDEEKQASVDRYAADVARSRQWREG